jgi:hypothetical protein
VAALLAALLAPLTALDDILLPAGIHHRLIVSNAPQTCPALGTLEVSDHTCTFLAFWDGGAAAIAV